MPSPPGAGAPCGRVERKLVAAWPTVVRPRRGGDVHAGAPITPYLGPLLTAGDGAHRRSRELEQLELLLERLGDFAHLEARCSPEFDYWTPLHWHGFSQTTHYTWRLPEVSDTEAVFDGVRENVRREIRKARKRVEIEKDRSSTTSASTSRRRQAKTGSRRCARTVS